MLTEIDQIPDGILELEAHQLIDVLPGPTLIHLKGRNDSTVFASVLLHGNEPTGWDAIRKLLSDYTKEGTQLPRNLSIFIGNVKAASRKLRRLDGQADYNRVWPGSLIEFPETKMMQQVVESMRKRDLFVSIDVHNNTGINPHYGCINKTDNRFIRLASLFSRLIIYFTKPAGVQSLAFAEHCPAVTIEAGKVGDLLGISRTRQFIDDCLHLSELPDTPLPDEDFDLYHTVAIVKIPPNVSFGFNHEERIIKFDMSLEKFNFSELAKGTKWAEIYGSGLPLKVTNEDEETVTDKYFANENGLLVNRVPLMPSMLTTDEKVVEQDCLCYLMERY